MTVACTALVLMRHRSNHMSAEAFSRTSAAGPATFVRASATAASFAASICAQVPADVVLTIHGVEQRVISLRIWGSRIMIFWACEPALSSEPTLTPSHTSRFVLTLTAVAVRLFIHVRPGGLHMSHGGDHSRPPCRPAA